MQGYLTIFSTAVRKLSTHTRYSIEFSDHRLIQLSIDHHSSEKCLTDVSMCSQTWLKVPKMETRPLSAVKHTAMKIKYNLERQPIKSNEIQWKSSRNAWWWQ